MSPAPDTFILADHSVVLAIPAFAPAILVVGIVVYIAVRDRRAEAREREHTDGAPDTEDKDA
ncbi:hypothetical protein [Antrihabitans sp. YC2-6]|uniref:hypothetical protein n=1 Tax=Antrihabitans sp. YC2-6 TaxID=2799498 RepID=UPI0018F611D6|nr:hypothetical protein [Antrihabitans sp. YC2-6]MBJ8347667.1 hypothetical protein [Antrihabitans sp. YC2-6]